MMSTLKDKRLFYFVMSMLLLVGMLAGIALPVQQVSAINHVGRMYFSNRAGTTGILGYCPVINGGYPYGNNKEQFIAFIESTYADTTIRGCNGARNTGAAYVVRTMLGQPAGQSKIISAGDWSDWKSRVRNPDIELVQTSINVKNTLNTSTRYTSSIEDVGQFIDNRGKSFPSTVFRNRITMQDYYILKNECANPLGDLPGLPVPVPPPAPYSLSATSTADHATAKPGDRITWTHVLKNDGLGATTQNTHSNVGMSGFTNGWGYSAPEYSPADTPAGAGVGNIRTSFAYNIYDVQQADVGNTLCEWVQYDPTDSQGNRNGRGPHACVSIPYGYALTPTVSVDTIGVVEPGSTVNVTPKVNNTGPTKSQNTQWQVTQIVVAPGRAVPNAAGGTSPVAIAPCGTYFQALPNATCSTVKSGTSVFDTNSAVLSGNQLTANPVIVGDLATGTKICFAFSVQPSSNSSDVWTHSAPAPTCVTIGKKPKVQVLGSDLSVGRSYFGSVVNSNIKTSLSTKNISGTNKTFGSWVEYGIFATGYITGTGSASAYVGGLANAKTCDPNLLSFTNAKLDKACDAPTIGNYATTQSIPDVSSNFPITSTTALLSSNDLSQPKAQGVYTTTSDITLSGATIAKGQWVVINAPDYNVTIGGNIMYTSEQLASTNDIPQLIIIAKNINIDSSVTQVDAWLIAKPTSGVTDGVLNTCSPGLPTAPLTVSLCDKPLTVNGPVMANKLFLRRTAGSGTGIASGDPAETFNLRPDAYIWASAHTPSNGRIRTVYTIELPPRL